jgi:hypothetical protein
MTPGNNPEAFIQNNHGESLQAHRHFPVSIIGQGLASGPHL